MNKISLIVGSTRQNRLGKPIADWLVATAKDAGVELNVLDLKEINLPPFDAPVSPAYKPTETVDGKAWQARVAESNAFVFLTSEYNRSIPSSLKNAIDYLYEEWKDKPAHIVSYGYVDGGGNATKHLKDILGWLKLDIIEKSQTIKLTQDTFDENGQFKDIDASLESVKEEFISALQSLSN